MDAYIVGARDGSAGRLWITVGNTAAAPQTCILTVSLPSSHTPVLPYPRLFASSQGHLWGTGCMPRGLRRLPPAIGQPPHHPPTTRPHAHPHRRHITRSPPAPSFLSLSLSLTRPRPTCTTTGSGPAATGGGGLPQLPGLSGLPAPGGSGLPGLPIAPQRAQQPPPQLSAAARIAQMQARMATPASTGTGLPLPGLPGLPGLGGQVFLTRASFLTSSSRIFPGAIGPHTPLMMSSSSAVPHTDWIASYCTLMLCPPRLFRPRSTAG